MKKLLIILLALASMQLGAQDLPRYKRVVKELSSARYQGRGYARDIAHNQPQKVSVAVEIVQVSANFLHRQQPGLDLNIAVLGEILTKDTHLDMGAFSAKQCASI